MSKQQTVPTISWWKNNKIIIRIVISVFLVIVVFIVASYFFHWNWTGLTNSPKTTTVTEVTQPSNTKKVTSTIEDQPGKTLWDWLQLLGVLAIPIVVGFGTAFFTRQQAKTSEANVETQQQEEFLRSYFDKLSDLMLDKELSTDQIEPIIRARTLSALHILNSKRKAIVLRFLHDSNLLHYVKRFLNSLDLSNTDLNSIDLSRANLSRANLSRTDLSRANLLGTSLLEADLSNADLYRANLSRTDLSGAKLIQATLGEANLRETILLGADLREADLSRADLREAILFGADLREADLSRANLTEADLGKAKLSGASITPIQLQAAKNISPEQLAQIKLSKPAALQQATTAQRSTILSQSEIKPDQTSHEEAEQ